ncbi:MAG: hypothetical protein SO122_07890, partial [Eubacteriales bacterium]|nr:hypothetical protein [Eubacteriales bacterium]
LIFPIYACFTAVSELLCRFSQINFLLFLILISTQVPLWKLLWEFTKILRFFEIPFYAEVLCARVFAQGASGSKIRQKYVFFETFLLRTFTNTENVLYYISTQQGRVLTTEGGSTAREHPRRIIRLVLRNANMRKRVKAS